MLPPSVAGAQHAASAADSRSADGFSAQKGALLVIDAWFDYGCPLSMLTRHLLDAKLKNSATPIRWHPHEGGHDVRDRRWTAQVWERSVRPLAERVGVRVNRLPPRAASTRLALQGYQYAVDHGCGEAYSDQVYHAYFARRLDIGQPQVLAGVAREAGLDPERFSAAAVSSLYVERHRAAMGRWPSVEVAPTLVAGGYRVEGVPSEAQLTRLVAESRRPRVANRTDGRRAILPSAATGPSGRVHRVTRSPR